MRSGQYLRLAMLGLSVVLMAGCISQRNGFPGGGGAVIPPIDANKPSETETATFALG
jgi:hypothetical protein